MSESDARNIWNEGRIRRTVDLGTGILAVKRTIDTKRDASGEIAYRVVWKVWQYIHGEDKWVPIANLAGCNAMIVACEKSRVE